MTKARDLIKDRLWLHRKSDGSPWFVGDLRIQVLTPVKGNWVTVAYDHQGKYRRLNISLRDLENAAALIEQDRRRPERHKSVTGLPKF